MSFLPSFVVRRINFLKFKFWQFYDSLPFVQKKYKQEIKESHIPLELKKIDKLLFLLYKKRSGYECAIERNNPKLASDKIFLTYGEILPLGLKRLLDFIEPNQSDRLIDLGSGAGKVVIQAFLASHMEKCYGIEVDPVRNQVANDALADLKSIAPELLLRKSDNYDNHIQFINENIADYAFNDVSLIFMNSICFGENLMSDIVKQINDHPNIRAVMSTKRVEGLQSLDNIEIIPVETSWHIPPNRTNCFVYYK